TFVRCGRFTGTLVVTLEGRPVQHHLRLVGSRGVVHSDFVLGTVQRLIGPGTSSLDKALAPFRLGRQAASGAAAALTSRLLRGQRGYPGLAEITDAFYRAIRAQSPAPLSQASIIATQRICDHIAAALATSASAALAPAMTAGGRRVCVTGAMGFLGSAVVRQLVAAGAAVRALVRREVAPWERVPGAEYVVSDLGGKLESERLAVQLGAELGVQVKIARPGAIVDTRHFDPPGRLGKRLGPWFVAVGSPRDRVAVVERDLAARTLAWLALHFEDAPCT